MTEKVLQIGLDEEKNVNGLFDYEADSKQYHRFQIKTDKAIVGTVYAPKDRNPLPDTIVLVRGR